MRTLAVVLFFGMLSLQAQIDLRDPRIGRMAVSSDGSKLYLGGPLRLKGDTAVDPILEIPRPVGGLEMVRNYTGPDPALDYSALLLAPNDTLIGLPPALRNPVWAMSSQNGLFVAARAGDKSWLWDIRLNRLQEINVTPLGVGNDGTLVTLQQGVLRNGGRSITLPERTLLTSAAISADGLRVLAIESTFAATPPDTRVPVPDSRLVQYDLVSGERRVVLETEFSNIVSWSNESRVLLQSPIQAIFGVTSVPATTPIPTPSFTRNYRVVDTRTGQTLYGSASIPVIDPLRRPSSGVRNAALSSDGRTLWIWRLDQLSVVAIDGDPALPAYLLPPEPPITGARGSYVKVVDVDEDQRYFANSLQLILRSASRDVAAPVLGLGSVSAIGAQIPWEAPTGPVTAIMRQATSFFEWVRQGTYREYLPAFESSGSFTAITRGPDGLTLVQTLPVIRAAKSIWIPVSSNIPAERGEWVHMYMTGLGPVTPRPATGRAAPANPLSRLDRELTCSAALPQLSTQAETLPVAFAGLAPGLLGVYQVSLRAPMSLSGPVQVTCTLALGSGSDFAASSATGILFVR